MSKSGIYKPPNWYQEPPMVSITVPGNGGQSVINSLSMSEADVPGGMLFSATPLPVGNTTYVFDAVLDLEHEQRLEATHHPIQTGADINTHAYLQPARLTLYVLMSDAVAQYGCSTKPGSGVALFTGSSSKSVSAYQTVLSIQSARQPLTVVTRLRTYTNMIITSVAPREDSKTITGLRMRVEFTQIITAAVSTVPVSARPADTDTNTLGQVSPTPVPSTTSSQFGVTPKAPTVGTTPAVTFIQYAPHALPVPIFDVPGAGVFTSFINGISTAAAIFP